MNSKKVFFVMLGVLGLLTILIVGSVIVGDRLLRKQSAKLVGLKLDNQVIETQQIALAQAKKDITKYNDLESIAKQIVPQDKDQARATREILNLADQSGIKISSISFPASTLGSKPAPVPAAPAGDAAETTVPTAPPAPTVTQVKPVEGIPNLFQLDLIVTSDPTNPATYPRLIDFLGRLEKNRRTAQVSQISITPDAQNRSSLNFTLTVTLYIKP